VPTTLYVLVGKSLTFKAISTSDPLLFPTGTPVWGGSSDATGTSETMMVTFSTLSSTTSDFKTVTATCGNTSMTAYVIVYDFTPILTPQDNFEGRDLDYYGVCELIDLSFSTSPSGIGQYYIGGLKWQIDSGKGALTDNGDGTGTYECADVADTVTLNGVLPVGATTVPALPVVGNPACVSVNWTPALNQLGVSVFSFTAVDTHQRTAACQINVLVAECYQFVGRGDSGTTVVVGSQSFQSHLGAIRFIWPVTMVDRPSIKIPNIASGQLNFSMQTVMHNPDVFPLNPDQWSQRLRVTILPGQVVLGDLHQSLNGIHQSLATFTDPIGDHYVTFPFGIDGM